MKMESLELIKPILDSRRVKPYFEKYKYKALLKLNMMGYFRDITTYEKFERRLNDKISLFGYYPGGSKTLRTIKQMVDSEGEDHLTKLSEVINWRQNNTTEVKYVIRHNSVEIYSSDLTVLTDLVLKVKTLNIKAYLYESDILKNYDREVVYHREPKHKFRVYLRQKRLTKESTLELKNFIDGHGLSISPSMKYYMNNVLFGDGYARPTPARLQLATSNYIDIDDEKYITVLSLTYPDIVRKVCRIEKR